ncbi:MAG TPA: methylated-DNA--[protein]-cysteine S-methyltransferase [Propionibacteriaceae bacterium]|nr:methylated-DNA--[protein]-cysteine S-methyltransferase [Propionibacteriaceae bacterium]
MSDTDTTLATLTEVSDDTRARLHEQLVAAAAADALLDVAYRIVDSPLGPLLVAATERGLVRLAYQREDHEAVLHTLAERVSPRLLHAPRQLDDAARQLGDYFAGHRREFGLPLDLRLSRGFRRQVLEHLVTIGYGQRESYAAVASLTGHPKAIRAVGSACATNPIPIIVPCHRVLRSDGSLGGYVGGLAAKQALLRLEGAG